MFRLFAPALFLVLLSCQTAGSPGPAAAPLRIASWNTEHLTAELGAGCAPRDAADLDLVTDEIARVDADIWLLQEVDGAAALERVFGPGWTFYVEDRPASGEYPLCRGRDDGARLRAQNTAIAIRKTIAHEKLPDLAALDLEGERRTRYGVAIRLAGETPTDIMSVHLASGCFSGSEAGSCPLLLGQAGILERWIDEASEAGRAVIIGGDFNRRLETEADLVWSDLNDGTPSGLHIAGAGTGPACDPKYSEFIDFIVMNDRANSRALAGSFRESVPEGPRRPSDHCAISIEMGR